MRAGVSRTAVEVVILIAGVALVLLVASPVGKMISAQPGKPTPISGLQAMDGFVSFKNETHVALSIVLRNAGTRPIGTVGSDRRRILDEWAFTTGRGTCSVYSLGGWPVLYALCRDCDYRDGAMEPYEVWNLVVICPREGRTSSFPLQVYGPGAARTALTVQG